MEIHEGHLIVGLVAHLGEHTAEVQCLEFHGVSERKERIDDLRQTCEFEIQFRNRHFWAEGYYVSTVGLNEATIKKYIAEQEQHDIASGQAKCERI